MLDIVHALKWVRANIAEFGGDPGNVTIFGQSGGGRKVATLLAMPPAKGLFHRAIIESGATIRLVEPEQAARVARELLRELALSPRQWRELQTVPLATLMSAYFATVRRMNVDQMTMGFSPVVDGEAVAQHPFHPQAAAVSADVPLIIGATRTELTSSADAAAFALDEVGMRARVGDLLGDSASRVIDVYARAKSRCFAVGPLLSDRERRALWRARHEDRRAPCCARPRRRLSLLLSLGDAARGWALPSAAHGRDSVRVPQPRGFAVDARCGGRPTPGRSGQ
jgi:carboxylesterase type B